MNPFNVDVLQMKKNHHSIGVRTAELLKERRKIEMLESITKDSIDYESMKDVFFQFAPHLLEELEGLGETLQIPAKKAASLFSGYDVPKVAAMGCTAYVTNSFYVRNYDFSPEFYDGIFSIIKSNQGFASAGYNLQGIGRHDGVNEKGVVVGLHFVSNTHYAKGLSAWTTVRIILDTCSSVEEAINLLKDIPHVACYNFSLGDPGNFAVVEVSPKGVSIRRDKEFLSCFNNFKQPNMKDKNRPSIEGSLKREHYLQQYEKEALSREKLFQMFSDPASALFFTEYDKLFGTLHTFSYSFQESRVVTTIARGSTGLDFRLPDWLNGQDVEVQRLYGAIEM
ncbi:C45 family autoproteolytic acyltransferase/hydolase [Pontibacillus salipaludis]|uniref:Choloylglycine hydrolase n=1 Tax=Pontibacillus salipaludis TaxID=1697394 RepID=A0ABQ1QF45_9BACI|nr:C45 family peptidase [Pontibacillus salipaludis]GGD25326.1 choloylglycine hydrolase [Pontibacillus salipaludis]